MFFSVRPIARNPPRLAAALLFADFGDVIHFFRNRGFEPEPAMLRRCQAACSIRAGGGVVVPRRVGDQRAPSIQSM